MNIRFYLDIAKSIWYNSAAMQNETTINKKEKSATKLLFTIKEAAEILSISAKSVRRLIERDLLKINPALRIKLITLDSLESFAKMTL